MILLSALIAFGIASLLWLVKEIDQAQIIDEEKLSYYFREFDKEKYRF